MSIDTDPANYDFAPPALECPFCFPVGETPLQQIVTFSGIKFGTAVPGVDPPPPNGLYIITTDVACGWHGFAGLYEFSYSVTAPGLALFAQTAGPTIHFIEIAIAPCQTTFVNDRQNPAVDPYYGGFASVINPKGISDNALQDVLALLNISPTGDPWANIRTIDAETTAYSIYNPADATRIHIGYKPT